MTWTSYDGVNAWTRPGGDISGDYTEWSPYETMGGSSLWYGWRLPVHVAQGWVDGSRANLGFQVNGRESEGQAPNNVFAFASTEGSSAQWPYLDVWYETFGQTKSEQVMTSGPRQPVYRASSSSRTARPPSSA